MIKTIEPRTGTAFTVSAGERFAVIDPEGGQVSDLLAFNANDVRETISSGRTFDYASKIYLGLGDALYSNRSNVLLRIAEDDVGCHDFLLTPCSRDTFRILYGHDNPHHGCFGNLANALAPFGISEDSIPCAFNVFMNVPVNGETGTFEVLPPKSRAGDRTVFEAQMDLIIALTACSAPLSNGGTFKPIQYEILR